MPLFKRRDQSEPDRRDDAPPPGRILDEREILDRIEEELFRAARYARPLVVLCARPQVLGDESLPGDEVRSAAALVEAALRFSDRVGVLADGSIVAVLPETPIDVARVVAHRIGADLTARSASTTMRKWLVGTSTYPDDGEDPPAVVTAALARAAG